MNGHATASGTSEESRERELYERAEDLEQIIRRWTRSLETKTPAVMTVTGEPGIGKTALLRQVADAIGEASATEASLGPIVLRGGTDSPQAELHPYLPLENAIRFACDPVGGPPILERFRRSMIEHMPSLLGSVPTAGPLLSTASEVVKDIATSASSPTPMSDPRRREFLEWIEIAVREAPVALLLDDMHWSDGSTLDLLSSLLATHPSSAIIIVLSYRPTDLEDAGRARPLKQTLPAIAERHEVIEVSLQPLSAMGMKQLVRDLTGRLPTDRLLDLVRSRSQGNPLFLENLLSSWQEGDLLEQITDGALDAPRVREHRPGEDLRGRIKAVLETRVGLLRPTERRVLEIAAVVGSPFLLEQIAAVGEMQAEQVRVAIQSICERPGFIDSERVASGRYGYALHHPLMAEHLCERLRLNRPVYAELHEAAARLDLMDAENGDLRAIAQVARHYAEARIPTEALAWCIRAANANMQTGALAEATIFAGWALAFTDGVAPREIASILAVRGHLQLELRRLEDGVHTLTAAAEKAVEAGLHETVYTQIQLELGKAHRMQNDWSGARDALRVAAECVRDEERELRAEIGLVTGEILLCGDRPEPSSARDVLLEALANAQDARLRAAICGHLALVDLALGAEDGCVGSWLDRAETEAIASNNPAAQYEIALYRVHVALAEPQLTAAQASLERMKSLSEQHGINDTENFRYEARILALQGRMQEAASAYRMFFVREAERCVLAGSRGTPANEERLWWAPAHLEEQTDELLRWCEVDAAREFLGQVRSLFDFEALAEVYPDLKHRVDVLAMGARHGHNAAAALRHTHTSRPDALAARWAFSLYVADLADRRAAADRSPSGQ
jgi:hypothetical protein